MKETAASADHMSAGIITRPGISESLAAPHFILTAEVIRDGERIWSDTFRNVVTRQGKKEVLDQTLGGGTGATWHMGLIDDDVVPSVLDTAASHSGWGEATTNYTGAPARKTCVFGSAQDNANNADIAITQLSWAITGNLTIYGAFIQSASTGTGGLLYSAGLFAAGRTLQNNDTLNINGTWTIT